MHGAPIKLGASTNPLSALMGRMVLNLVVVIYPSSSLLLYDLPVLGSHSKCFQNSSRGLGGSSLGGGGFCLAK